MRRSIVRHPALARDEVAAAGLSLASRSQQADRGRHHNDQCQ